MAKRSVWKFISIGELENSTREVVEYNRGKSKTKHSMHHTLRDCEQYTRKGSKLDISLYHCYEQAAQIQEAWKIARKGILMSPKSRKNAEGQGFFFGHLLRCKTRVTRGYCKK